MGGRDRWWTFLGPAGGEQDQCPPLPLGIVHGVAKSQTRLKQVSTRSGFSSVAQLLGSQHQGTPVFWEWRPLPRDPWPQTPVVRAGQVEASKHSPRPGGRRVDRGGGQAPQGLPEWGSSSPSRNLEPLTHCQGVKCGLFAFGQQPASSQMD